MDEQQRQSLLDDLKGFIRGELLFDEVSRSLYSTDASIFQLRPLGVVVPRDAEDVQNLVRYAAQHQVPLIPRGAGSGVAGEALGTGVIVDLSRHFRAVLEVKEDSIRVQVGLTCSEVNARLAPLGRRFAPDPANADQCTIGGMLGTNASGARALKHGYTRDQVHQLGVVLDSGDLVRVGQEPLLAADRPGHLQDILTALAVLLEEHAELIRTCYPRTPFNRCGYLLQGVLKEERIDLPRLLIGSEGTLALFTEATLRTLPLPASRAVVLLGLGSLEAALRVVQLALPSGPSACELIDRRLLSLARGDADLTALIPAGAEAVVLLEYESDQPERAAATAQELVQQLTRGERLVVQALVASEPAEVDRLWRLRQVALPNLYALGSGARPVPFIEDVGVPVEELGTYLVRVQDIFKELEITSSFLIHAGAGQVHARPFLDLHNPPDAARLPEIAERVHTLALELGGTISTQHGTGLARTPWVARQFGPLYPVLRQVKAIFDPHNIFNPGKIVDPAPRWSAWPLRLLPQAGPVHEWALRWQNDQVRGECLKCNGCGQCRQETTGQRMCPIFHATHAEAASPRAKANLLRQVLLDNSTPPNLASPEVREVADLCVGCRMCAVECPAHVNIPKLMLEARAANVAEHGLDRSDWFFARIEEFCRWGHRFPLLTNLVLGSRWGRWLLEKMFGLSRERRLPRLVRRNFLRLARRRGWSRRQSGSHQPRVAYFVDLFANYHDTLIAEAAVAVLRHNGIDVYVPPEQRGCGLAPLAHGDVDAAREIARHNLRWLTEAVREGCTVVCSEPTAALVLRQDYLDLVDDPDAELVARNTVELTAYLLDLHRQGKLRTEFRPLELSLGHHVPCHIKALGPAAGPVLLSLIPGLRVHTIDVSCSGMAGLFGLRSENRTISLAAGRRMLEHLQQPEIRHGSTECSPCRLQMEDAGGKRTLHPVQYLALAYGLLPELSRRLHEPFGELTLR